MQLAYFYATNTFNYLKCSSLWQNPQLELYLNDNIAMWSTFRKSNNEYKKVIIEFLVFSSYIYIYYII